MQESYDTEKMKQKSEQIHDIIHQMLNDRDDIMTGIDWSGPARAAFEKRYKASENLFLSHLQELDRITDKMYAFAEKYERTGEEILNEI